MINFRDQIFLNPKQLLADVDVIFVSDLFADDYIGGAELTSEALITESPFKLQKIHSRDVNISLLTQGKDKFWIFGNFSQLNAELIPSIVANLKYAVLEYDYKYCRFRSPEKHENVTGQPCDCANQLSGKLVSAFYYGATSLWWMSEKQKQTYLTLFPFLSEKDNIVLSSVFSKNILGTIRWLRDQAKSSVEPRKGWIVVGSDSWIKGTAEAKAECESEGLEYEVVGGVPYDVMLDKLAHAEGLMYMPPGGDTCPRLTIEAKLLGCKLRVNDNVQHKDEEWFATDDLDAIHDYLYTAPQIFWKGIRTIMAHRPKISGYTTTYNCESQGYPFIQSIKSMLQFCDEVCVVDGGSTDKTLELLQTLAQEDLDVRQSVTKSSGGSVSPEPRLKVRVIPRDWSHPRHAVFDGMQKAEARKMCTGDFCWQMDSDEIVHEDDAPKVADLCSKIPRGVDILALPVIEYWGGPNKVRCDIQPWKWRLSRNRPHITHGIPIEFRRSDASGDYAAEGTDGCDMIHAETGERLPHVTFHTPESESLRQAAVAGHPDALQAYETWFNEVILNLPGVHHYSWYDMVRKIKTYRSFWTKFWNSLYGKSIDDTAENNMFFDKPWSQVTDDEIVQRAAEIKDGTGGWIWHRKWSGQRVPHIIVDRKEPSIK